MCILCVIQKWYRRVATMLPWLVIPLIGLWALSHLLPPAFRFEITSPRLACVFVLLVTLFWYEVLMPQLSAWRVRRNSMLRERMKYEAIELQKLRKTATKRCRNCLTPYKDQNPGCGKFVCSYCGHISKRPVLDLPVLPGFSSSGIIKDLVGRSGKLLNGKVWSDNGWMCGQDWVEDGNWVGKSAAGKSSYRRNNENSLFGGDEHCFTKKSYSGICIFACKLLTSFFLSIRWLWRKIFRVSTSSGDALSDVEHKGMLAKRDDGGVNFQERRGERARRKAEEKRQARLERELLEEEERKQREEVAKLVEERRKMRDEKMETEKDHGRISVFSRANDSKKEAEKRRNERRKEKEKGFSKSYSDAEELEKRVGKDSDQKRDFDKKCKTGQQEIQKSGVESGKSVCLGVGPGIKKRSTDNLNEGNVGTRYLDRMRGTIWYSSKSFSGGSLFATKNTTIVIKENMSNSSVDPSHTSGFGRDTCPPESVAGKNSIALDDKNIHPVLADLHTSVAPKKSWQQLFTQSSSVPGSTNQNVISRPLSKSQVDANNLLVSSQASSTQSFENPLSFGLPSPFNLSSYPDGSINSNLGLSPAVPSTFPYGEGTRDFIREEAELFQDPCYIPNPVSLLGSVSESLDNFQLDMGTGFESGIRLEGACALENLHTFSEITKLSPIESPLSREKHNGTNWYPGALTTDDMQTSPIYGLNSGEKGTWQMWNSYPLGQEGLGIVGGPASWVPPPDHSRLNRNEIFHASSQRTMASLFTKDEQVPPGNHSPHNVFLGNGRSGRTFSPVMCSGDHNPWSQKALFPPFPGTENHFVLNPHEDIIPNELVCGERSRSDTNYPLVAPPVNRWFMNEWSMQGACEGAGQSSLKPPVGQFPNTNVQSSLTLTVRGMGFVPLWSS